jgi:prolyl-tRNA editing enzyme YbaK/EbsC (Cys-tRNA(Pro) deacylase)
MKLGKLTFNPIQDDDGLVSKSISSRAYESNISDNVFVAEINPEFADTASFCEHYEVDLGISTNCLIIEAKRADKTWYSACLVLATDMADVNGIVRRALGARKTSFASKDTALELTGMEYGGITPIGLPANWSIYVDEFVMNQEVVVIGGGLRGSKIAVETRALLQLPNVHVLNIKR